MEVIDGQWYMEGLDMDDPACIRSAKDLLEVIEKTGFLPLFSNSVPGFSVEEMTCPSQWWTGSDLDPWSWREELCKDQDVAYGKFFKNKAGYISKKWFPYLANFRRDGYDFDALYSDGKAGYREKLLMDLFVPEGVDMWDVKDAPAYFTYEMKDKAGFGKNGEKNFDGVLARLQMRTYLIVGDLAPRLNKQGEAFGWSVARMQLPESKWGYKHVTSRYKETPKESYDAIIRHISALYPEGNIKKLI